MVGSIPKSFLDSLAEAVAHIKSDGSPNINALWLQLKELNAIKWSLKQQGYDIARTVFENIQKLPVPDQPSPIELTCKCSTQKDVESDWFRYWMSQLQVAPLPHRKLWEFAFILQALHQYGMLNSGRSGIGFGCGEEPLPSYFASRGVRVTVTDLEPKLVEGMGWAETGQHTNSLDVAFKGNLVDREIFVERVGLRYVDMNKIPEDLSGKFDFCWSVCALEHLGSINNGLEFILKSISVLKVGGVALHTTEFNYTESHTTIDNWPTVLFLRKHFEYLNAELKKRGHRIFPLNFGIGTQPLDSFVDLPPYDFSNFLSYTPSVVDDGFRPGHLKLSVDGFPSTCFGFIAERQV